MDEELERRRSLTFKQAEGLEPLPKQLARHEISKEVRAVSYNIFKNLFNKSINSNGEFIQESEFYSFAIERHFHIDFGFSDEFYPWDVYSNFERSLKYGEYPDFYESIQSLCRSDYTRQFFTERISKALENSQSAYRIFEGTLIPIGSDEELSALNSALTGLPESSAAKRHLREAIVEIGSGRWSNAIRESIHSVESISRQITGASSLAIALNKISKTCHIHPAMVEAFKKLYGYTSDESGIRHALLEDGDSKVTEADAMFMLGACAAFISYLTANARRAELLPEL